MGVGNKNQHTLREPAPIRKLSGLTSRCMYERECINSSRDIIWSAIIRVVLRENLFPQKLNKSSNDGPSKSITRTL